jgi:UDP-N-acetylmuramyl pentapeptide phosphotransferase/UDP-N-acetylglucosamine-1-phosphate transferase
LTLLLVRSAHRHSAFSGDNDLGGPQKFHAHPVPRIGGLAVVGGLGAASLLLWRLGDADAAKTAWLLLLCGAPTFLVGLAEDLTKKVDPSWRLVATAGSGLLAVGLLSASIHRTDLWGLDWVVSFGAGAVCVAIFAVTGIANAVNIIDGFNGLASMCVVIMLLALTYVATQVGDSTIVALSLLGAGAVVGFFIWNFPAGLIFLGDGGAYFLGFYVAELGILLLQRNPEVSPLFPLLMCIYPIFETLFSIYRKKLLRGISPGMPDGVHLHMLVYRRLLRWGFGKQTAKELTRRNSMTSPYLWLLCMMAVVPSVLFWDNSRVLGACIVLFAAGYIVLYRRIVRFKSPRWLVSRK